MKNVKNKILSNNNKMRRMKFRNGKLSKNQKKMLRKHFGISFRGKKLTLQQKKQMVVNTANLYQPRVEFQLNNVRKAFNFLARTYNDEVANNEETKEEEVQNEVVNHIFHNDYVKDPNDKLGLKHLNTSVKQWFKSKQAFINKNTEIRMFFGLSRTFSQGRVKQILDTNGGNIWNRTFTNWFLTSGSEAPTYFVLYKKLTITIVQNKELKPKAHVQKLLDGEVSHCVLDPILSYYVNKDVEHLSKNSKKKHLKYVKRCLEYKEIYKEGIPTDGDHLQKICDSLRIDLSLTLPTCRNTYINKKSKIKGNKHFKFQNTRFNHVDLLSSSIEEVEELTDPDEMKIILDEIHNAKRVIPFKEHNGKIIWIKDRNKEYRLKTTYQDAVNEFEEKNEILLSKKLILGDACGDFIKQGCHNHGCIDFHPIFNFTSNVCKICHQEIQTLKDAQNHHIMEHDDKKFTDCFERKQQTVKDQIKRRNIKYIKSIDQAKSYYNFEMCPYYDGFLCKVPHFRFCDIPINDACKTAGFYQIDEVDFTDCKYAQHMRKLNFVKDDMIFPHPMIKLLHDIGVKFKIIAGAYGSKMDMVFGEDMLEKYEDVRHYQRWTGVQQCCYETTNFQFIKHDIKYLQNLQAFLINQRLDASLTYNNESEYATLRYKKEIVKHRSHISGYLTCYSMITTMLQLFEIDYKDIVRVIVDGIYYFDVEDKYSNIKLIGSNDFEKEKFGRNASIYHDQMNETKSFVPFNTRCLEVPLCEYVKYRNVLLKMGAGGNGKTYSVLKDPGFRNVVYMGHSHKLSRSVKVKYEVDYSCPYQHITQGNRRCHKPILENAELLLSDEVSTSTYNDILKIKKFGKTNGIPIIFAGDIGYQTDPCCGDYEPRTAEERLALFPYKEELLKNYRFTCPIHKKCIFEVRKMMDDKKHTHHILEHLKKNGYKFITQEEMYLNIELDDILLASEHKIYEKHNEVLKTKFTDYKKYKMKSTSKEYSNGEIVITDKKMNDKLETYGFTIHAVQGEDFEKNIYIDINRLKNNKILYTAISRAHRLDQIFFVGTKITPYVNNGLKKTNPYRNGKIYKITTDVNNKCYIGSTCKTLQERFEEHQNDFKAFQDCSSSKYYSSFDILEFGNCKIELVTNYDCSNKTELERFEGIFIKQEPNAVNKVIPGRTEKERKKEQEEKIKAKQKEKIPCPDCGLILTKGKLYRHKKNSCGKEKVTSKYPYMCGCGKNVKSDANRHDKSKKHMKWLETQTCIVIEETKNECSKTFCILADKCNCAPR